MIKGQWEIAAKPIHQTEVWAFIQMLNEQWRASSINSPAIDLPNDFQAMEVEKFLFGINGDHPILRPKIFTAISHTAHLIEGGLIAPAMVLANVDLVNPYNNWINGRLLRLPKESRFNAKLRNNFSSPILPGNLKNPLIF